MKIAIVCQARDSLVPPNIGSVARCTLEIAAALAPKHDVTVFGMCHKGDKDIELEDNGFKYKLFAWTWIDRASRKIFDKTRRFHFIFNRGYTIPIWGSRLLAPKFVKNVAQSLSDNPPDLILLQHSAIPAGAIRRALPDTPIVLQMHAAISGPSLSRVYKKLIGKVNAVSGVSHFVARDAEKKLGMETFRIRNGVRLPQLAPSSSGSCYRKKDIVFAGAVSPEKGVHDLIDGFNRICELRSDIGLKLAGGIGARPFSDVFPQDADSLLQRIEPMYSIDYKDYLEQRLSPRAAERCQFIGPLPWLKLMELIQESRVFVFPSVWEEGFGLPPLEAMALGTVPVVSARGALPEVVQDGVSGVVLDTTDNSRLAETICALMDDDERWRHLSEAAMSRAKSEFSWEAAGSDLVELAAHLKDAASGLC